MRHFTHAIRIRHAPGPFAGMLLVLLMSVSTSIPAAAQTPMTVGVKASPPFTILNDDGTWSGISIELLDAIAAELALDISYEPRELAAMFDDLEAGRLDAAVAALSITAEREQRMDFTHSYYSSGLGIAVPASSASYLSVLRGFVSWQFAKLILYLLAVLGVIGLIVWVFERRRNPEQFGGGVVTGMGSGLWWSAVTMTTVGYGDKSPVTFAGRFIGLIWMFASLIAISTFTASIASVITVSQLESSISGPKDLVNARIGCVADSTGAAFLRVRDFRATAFDTAEAGFDAIAAGEIDAFVYDAPILRFMASRDPDGVASVLPVTFNHQQYGIALRVGSTNREAINRVMLEFLDSDEWTEILDKYLGS